MIPITVLKFGSSVLTHPNRLSAVVHDIYSEYRQRRYVVVVVSAFGQHTDSLLMEARAISEDSKADVALASLLATGEQQAAALLTIALDRAGIPCRLFSASELSLTLEGSTLDADPVSMDVHFLQCALREVPVAVIPGFVGVTASGQCALMGRGGSDLTATFLAEHLGAQRCRLVKDVAGIYERDPAKTNQLEVPPQRFSHITYADAHRVSEELVQPKAIDYLESRDRQVVVSSLQHRAGTVVGTSRSIKIDDCAERPLRIVLLGLGTVGRGVYEHCLALPSQFQVVGIGVRNRLNHIAPDVPLAIINDDIDELLNRPHDVLVELTGDSTVAGSAIQQSLRAGRSVVTANKALLANASTELLSLAKQQGVALLYSAAVGGAAPMLELAGLARTAGGVSRLRGVLNGTCNYVLDKVAAGKSLSISISEAQSLGFAEADPRRDLSGEDSENKLRLLGALAYLHPAKSFRVRRNGVDAIDDASISQQGRVARLVATLSSDGVGRVGVEMLLINDPLAGAVLEENRLLIEFENGNSWLVKGKGAGRWPIAEAVMADLFELHALENRAVTSAPPTRLPRAQHAGRLPPLADA